LINSHLAKTDLNGQFLKRIEIKIRYHKQHAFYQCLYWTHTFKRETRMRSLRKKMLKFTTCSKRF